MNLTKVGGHEHRMSTLNTTMPSTRSRVPERDPYEGVTPGPSQTHGTGLIALTDFEEDDVIFGVNVQQMDPPTFEVSK
jgi:hypothetical protein